LSDFFAILPIPGREPEGGRLFRHGLEIAHDMKQKFSEEALPDWVKVACFCTCNGSGGTIVRHNDTGTVLVSIGTWFYADDLGPGDEQKLLAKYLRGGAGMDVRFVPILLQKSVEGFGVSDSVAVKRFATGAEHDGAAQSRPETIFLFIQAR
jgi:hypothetical protein